MSSSRGSTPELKGSRKRRKRAQIFGADFISFGAESDDEKASTRKNKSEFNRPFVQSVIEARKTAVTVTPARTRMG